MDTFYFVAFVLLVAIVVGKAMGFGDREIKLGDHSDVGMPFRRGRSLHTSSPDFNPATGLPMMNRAVDVQGNPYGVRLD